MRSRGPGRAAATAGSSPSGVRPPRARRDVERRPGRRRQGLHRRARSVDPVPVRARCAVGDGGRHRPPPAASGSRRASTSSTRTTSRTLGRRCDEPSPRGPAAELAKQADLLEERLAVVEPLDLEVEVRPSRRDGAGDAYIHLAAGTSSSLEVAPASSTSCALSTGLERSETSSAPPRSAARSRRCAARALAACRDLARARRPGIHVGTCPRRAV